MEFIHEKIDLGYEKLERTDSVDGRRYITKDGNALKIEGTTPKGEDNVNYLHKGIGGRSFRREFTLADHVDVKNAELANGMLNIHLVRELPEELQPKKIEINVGKTIEGTSSDK